MADKPTEEETMEAVALAPEAEESKPEEEMLAEDDPFALPEGVDAAVATAADETEEAPPTDTQKALESLKRSSVRLGSAIQSTATDVDSKVGITKTVSALDQKTRASQTFKGAATALGGWLSSVDSQLGVTQKTKELGSALNERVVEPIKPAVQESTRTLQTFDETHGITRSTASTLAKGADMLTQSLVGTDTKEPEPRDDEPSDGFLG